ncbi:hypothetical protein [Sphaerisporangium album]|uniref:hypothetical protein n=1 Tax=Sphaerisporangium album TaxID=509200 RepID=UPI0015F00DA4|nr:hypothetical protein [Sphaerisporangium album]
MLIQPHRELSQGVGAQDVTDAGVGGRLRIRWEIRDDVHEAFMTLAAAIICRRRLIH